MKTFILLSAFVALAAAQFPFKFPVTRTSAFPTIAPRYHQQVYAHNEIPILRQASDISPDGSYSFSYETGNGIAAQEAGVGGQVANGGASWTAPDGTPVQFSYTADINGYQPSGSHIPQIPAAIVRSIEYNRAHPQKEEYYRREPISPYKTFRY